MRHMMLDCYGAPNFCLDDVMGIYNLLNGIVDIAELTPVAPPSLIPYYYCDDPEDVGISAYLFLKGGHITIHTFSKRECYFVDIMSPEFFGAEIIYKYLEVNLPFNKAVSNYRTNDRRVDDNDSADVSDLDFGPHLIGRVIPKKPLTLDSAFNALERLTYAADMQQISRANVIKDSNTQPSYIQGIVVIAQSHISLYYDTADNIIYFDLFSCAYFDYSKVETIVTELLGEIENIGLVCRGDKYVLSRSSNIESNILQRGKKWQKNI